MKIASYPGIGNPNNPYIDLFYSALQKHGVTHYQKELQISLEWLNENKTQFDCIHLNWPEVLWRLDNTPPKPSYIRPLLRNNLPGFWRILQVTDQLKPLNTFKPIYILISRAKGYLYFKRFLSKAKSYDLKIIWTFHNAEIHEGSSLIDRLGYKYLARISDLVILHGKIAQTDFLEKYRTNGQTIVMPIGNYDGVYPPPRPKEIILKELGLRHDLPIVSCLGMLRNYKGLDIATETMALLDDKVQFLCAGWPHPSFDIVSLKESMTKLNNAVLVSRFLSDQEFADYASISDCLFMPYKKITGSAVLLASLTLARGVIVSDLPYFQEILAKNKSAGRVAQEYKPAEFADSIIDYLDTPANERNKSARLLAEKYSWENVTKALINTLRSLK